MLKKLKLRQSQNQLTLTTLPNQPKRSLLKNKSLRPETLSLRSKNSRLKSSEEFASHVLRTAKSVPQASDLPTPEAARNLATNLLSAKRLTRTESRDVAQTTLQNSRSSGTPGKKRPT